MKPTKIFGLGGMQEIGKSTLVVEHDQSIFIIDAGIKFADSFATGVDGIIPNYSYLRENQEKIKGLFITHGHEDHLGGIPYLIQQVKIDTIYAPAIAIRYIKYKLKDKKVKIKVKYVEIERDLVLNFDDSKVDFWTAQHSIPDAFGIRISTPNGKLLCTGDFRFDYTPIGNLTDFKKLEQIGNEGLTILLSDSTNAMRPMHSPSESDILSDIEKFVKEAKGKIIITAFASNLTRVTAMIKMASKLNKKVVAFGRSMINWIKIGQNIGYIDKEANVLITKKDISHYANNEVIILTTGSQGEEMAALSRMASNKHAQIKIKYGDLVLFSSSPIPGNRMKIEELINNLYKQGAIIKENRIDGYLHTSGHAYKEEHEKIFNLTKPKYFLPYHGEYRMCIAHGNTAIECGVKEENVFIPKIGQVIEMKHGVVTFTKKVVDPGPIYIDGQVAEQTTNEIIKERVKLGESGFVSIVITIDRKKNMVIRSPKIISRGSFYIKNSVDIISEAKKLIHGTTLYVIKNNVNWTIPELKALIAERVESFFYKRKRWRPDIITSILFSDEKVTFKRMTPLSNKGMKQKQ